MAKTRYVAGDIGGTNARLSLFEVDTVSGEEEWKISKSTLKAQFKFAEVSLINDFAAIGFGLTALKPSDYVVLNEGIKKDEQPIACLGAGTGLGEVFLTHNGKDYDVWSTEGGNTDYPPKNEREFKLLEYVVNVEGKHRVSVERVVCGTAIPILYRFLKTQGLKEDPQIASELEAKGADKAKIISINGLSKENPDQLCYETMMFFLRNYFAEAGNLALKTLPRGGLYIAGGIAPKIINSILKHKEELMNVLFDKGRMSDLLRTLPIYIVTHPSIGELGSQVVARRLVAKAAHKTDKASPKHAQRSFVFGFAVGAVFAAVLTASSYLFAKKRNSQN